MNPGSTTPQDSPMSPAYSPTSPVYDSEDENKDLYDPMECD